MMLEHICRPMGSVKGLILRRRKVRQSTNERQLIRMKVVLFAGGHGARLSEDTDLSRKPMIEIGWHVTM